LRNAEVPQAALEGGATAAIAIVNQKSWRASIPSAAFDQLLGRPLRSRTWRHRHVQNFSVDVLDHKNDVKDLEQDCSNAKEVASPYIRFMPFQELAPSRGWSIRFTPFPEGHRRSREVKFDALLAE
jgi:hypothetical protein